MIWFNISLQKLCDGNTLKVSFLFMPIFRSLQFHNVHISLKLKSLCCKTHSRQKFQLSLLKDVFHNRGRNSLKLHPPQAKSNVPKEAADANPRECTGSRIPTSPHPCEQELPTRTSLSLKAPQYPAEFQSQADIKYKEPDIHQQESEQPCVLGTAGFAYVF